MARFVDETIDYLNRHRAAVPPVIAVLAFIGLGRLAKMAALGMAAAWAARELRDMDRSRSDRDPNQIADKIVDTAMEDSFPASDPPSYSSSAAGTPDEQIDAAKTPEQTVQIH